MFLCDHKKLFFFLLSIVINVKTYIICGRTENCVCAKYKSGEYEIDCRRKTNESHIAVHIDTRRNVVISCTDTTDYGLIDMKLSMKPEMVLWKNCPVPANGFRNFLDNLQLRTPKFIKFDYGTTPFLPNTTYFEGMADLESLSLNFDHLNELDDNFLDGMPNLLYLDLRNNNIELSSNLFQYTKKLILIDLSRNNLETIPKNVFHNLVELKELVLWQNNLRTITKEFQSLTNLNSLELSFNRLEKIEKNAFDSLINLININLHSNDLSYIPEDLFGKNRKLERIRFGANPKLILSEKLFANLPNLKDISLANSNLISLPKDLFQNSTALNTINLGKNLLTELPKELFENLVDLIELNLSSNKLEKLDDQLFEMQENLKRLYLNRNAIAEISGKIFANLRNLQELNLEMNYIQAIHLDAFLHNKHLASINLAYNEFKFDPGQRTPFYNCENLEELNLSYNLIEDLMEEDLIYTKFYLRKLDLSCNNIRIIEINPFSKVSQYELHVNLSNNNITEVDFYLMDLIDKYTEMFKNYQTAGLTIDLSHNRIICDCYAIDLVKYFQNDLDLGIKNLVKIIDDELRCASPKNLQNSRVSSVKAANLTCKLDEIIEDDYECPGQCDCYWRPYDTSIVLNCSNNNHTDIPNFIWPSTLRFNQTILHMENNFLTKIPDINETTQNVTQLYLSNNNIEILNSIPSRIEILDLTDNYITKLDDEFIRKLNNTNFRELILKNNPWTCDCETRNFSKFLRQHKYQINVEEIRCASTGIPIVNLHEDALCPNRLTFYLILLLIICLIVLILAILSSIYFRFQEEILSWLYANGLYHSTETDEKLKAFDAFFSYSPKDEDFVAYEILPMLEDGRRPYRLSLPYRHWLPVATIDRLTSRSLRGARRTVIILSEDFLEDVWGRYDLRMAHLQAFTDRATRFIFVVKEEMNLDRVDVALNQLMRTGKVLRWNEKRFWRRFLYALPHYKKT